MYLSLYLSSTCGPWRNTLATHTQHISKTLASRYTLASLICMWSMTQSLLSVYTFSSTNYSISHLNVCMWSMTLSQRRPYFLSSIFPRVCVLSQYLPTISCVSVWNARVHIYVWKQTNTSSSVCTYFRASRGLFSISIWAVIFTLRNGLSYSHFETPVGSVGSSYTRLQVGRYRGTRDTNVNVYIYQYAGTEGPWHRRLRRR